MGTLVAASLATGVLLPPSLMHAGPVRVLAAFVTVNTVMYGALAVAKVLPRLHPTTWFTSANRRAEERGIHPDGRPPAVAAPPPEGAARPVRDARA
jgi:hypothetical protein